MIYIAGVNAIAYIAYTEIYQVLLYVERGPVVHKSMSYWPTAKSSLLTDIHWTMGESFITLRSPDDRLQWDLCMPHWIRKGTDSTCRRITYLRYDLYDYTGTVYCTVGLATCGRGTGLTTVQLQLIRPYKVWFCWVAFTNTKTQLPRPVAGWNQPVRALSGKVPLSSRFERQPLSPTATDTRGGDVSLCSVFPHTQFCVRLCCLSKAVEILWVRSFFCRTRFDQSRGSLILMILLFYDSTDCTWSHYLIYQ